MISEARLKHLLNLEDILSRGEPPIKVKGGINPDWLRWYRAKHHVSGNVALAAAKRKVKESLEPKVEQPIKVLRAPANPYGRRTMMFNRG